MGYRSYRGWAPYVPVAKRLANGASSAARLLKSLGQTANPVVVDGRNITSSYWGNAWCKNLEGYGDFSNRLPRGRTYVRNGSVVHLAITAGKVSALVAGSSLYKVQIDISKLVRSRWDAIKKKCTGSIGSVVELLQGKFSKQVMSIVSSKDQGLFPAPKEISMSCSCPDYATMCKHVAATLYGVGARLDTEPELIFLLRGVDHSELISQTNLEAVAAASQSAEQISGDLEALFGIEITDAAPSTASIKPLKKPSRKPSRKPLKETRAQKAKPIAKSKPASKGKSTKNKKPTAAPKKKTNTGATKSAKQKERAAKAT